MSPFTPCQCKDVTLQRKMLHCSLSFFMDNVLFFPLDFFVCVETDVLKGRRGEREG